MIDSCQIIFRAATFLTNWSDNVKNVVRMIRLAWEHVCPYEIYWGIVEVTEERSRMPGNQRLKRQLVREAKSPVQR